MCFIVTSLLVVTVLLAEAVGTWREKKQNRTKHRLQPACQWIDVIDVTVSN